MTAQMRVNAEMYCVLTLYCFSILNTGNNNEKCIIDKKKPWVTAAIPRYDLHVAYYLWNYDLKEITSRQL